MIQVVAEMTARRKTFQASLAPFFPTEDKIQRIMKLADWHLLETQPSNLRDKFTDLRYQQGYSAERDSVPIWTARCRKC